MAPPAYEMMLVARKTNFAALLKRYGEAVYDAGGVLMKIENLGTKRLAYPMYAHQEKHLTGRYLLMHFYAPPTLPKELDRRLRIDEDIVRHLIVRTDEKTPQPDPWILPSTSAGSGQYQSSGSSSGSARPSRPSAF